MSDQHQKATLGNGAARDGDLTDLKLHRGSSLEAAVCLTASVTSLLAGQSRTSLLTRLVLCSEDPNVIFSKPS